jgi:hypothetical protein
MGRRENPLQNAISLVAPRLGARLLRNNSGRFQDKTGRWVHFGLGNSGQPTNSGSSDLIGPTTIVITQEMVGREMAIFTAVEAKAGSPVTEEQTAFLKMVRDRGGIACLAHTVEDFHEAVNEFKVRRAR